MEGTDDSVEAENCRAPSVDHGTRILAFRDGRVWLPLSLRHLYWRNCATPRCDRRLRGSLGGDHDMGGLDNIPASSPDI